MQQAVDPYRLAAKNPLAPLLPLPRIDCMWTLGETPTRYPSMHVPRKAVTVGWYHISSRALGEIPVRTAVAGLFDTHTPFTS